MAAETWYDGKQAVDAGFCDKLMFEDAETTVENAAESRCEQRFPRPDALSEYACIVVKPHDGPARPAVFQIKPTHKNTEKERNTMDGIEKNHYG